MMSDSTLLNQVDIQVDQSYPNSPNYFIIVYYRKIRKQHSFPTISHYVFQN